MQHLEVSCAVRRFFKSLGFKGLNLLTYSLTGVGPVTAAATTTTSTSIIINIIAGKTTLNIVHTSILNTQQLLHHIP